MMMLIFSVFTEWPFTAQGASVRCQNRIFSQIPVLAVSILAFRVLLFTVVIH